MYKIILETILKYNTILISRHGKPDMDALGSSIGLKSLILDNYPDKKVYVIGDMSRPCILGEMDDISNVNLSNALLILTDVSVKNLLPELPLKEVKEIICIDHHKNTCDIENARAYYDRKAAAACQIIAEMAFHMKLKISKETAKCLYAGIISDSNRFNFSLTKQLFETAGKLINIGFDYQSLYNEMYADNIAHVKMRAYFTSKFEVTPYGVGYLKNDASEIEKFHTDLFSVSRGMVNVMSNIEEIGIWCNFTQDPATNKIVCEFRSKKVEILPIAIKYGGGGHSLACGATVDSFDVADQIIEDFNNLLKG